MNRALVLLLAATPAVGLFAQSKPLVMVERLGSATLYRTSGGGVQISKGIQTVSAKSSLQLEWLMVTDSTLKILFDAPVGASGFFEDPWFRYTSAMKMRALDAVKAFEVRILTFNIWGEFTGTLSFTQLEDMAPGQNKTFDRVWGIFGESQLRAHVTSIAYVANVMLGDGKKISADPALVLKAAKAIQSSLTLQDLEPKAEPVPLQSKKA